MFILGISSNTVNFMAGKVHVFTDFDGTYFPYSQKKLRKHGADSRLQEYSNSMNRMLKSNNVHLHVTSGRNFKEYQTAAKLIDSRKVNLPMPESFISKNGSDEYIKTNSFFKRFPFKYTKTNKEKENWFKTHSNWNGEEIDNYIESLAKKYNLSIVKADTTHGASDYGSASIFSNEKNFSKNKNVIGIIKNGNLNKKIVFNQDSQKISKNFTDDLKKFLSNNNTKYIMHTDPEEQNCISYKILPKYKDKELNKSYDAKQALKKAIKNNDLVITAGNEINDFEMLNPLEYFDQDYLNTCKHNSTNKEFYTASAQKKLKILEKVLNGSSDEYSTKLRAELQTNGFLQKLDEMPFCGIVIKGNNPELCQLVKTFENTGKIVETEYGKLDEGLKIAVQNYAKKKPMFKDVSSQITSKIQGKKTYKKPTIIAGGAIILTTVGITIYQNLKNIILYPAEREKIS